MALNTLIGFVLVLQVGLNASSSFAAKIVAVKAPPPATIVSGIDTKGILSMASIHLLVSGQKRAYFIKQNPKDKKVSLELVLANGRIQKKPISEVLASHIQADLVDLAWKTKYKSTFRPGSKCHEIGTLVVGSNPKALESASICREQVKEFQELAGITRNLDGLLK